MVEVVSLMYIRWPMENAVKKDKNSHCLIEKCLITNEKVQIFLGWIPCSSIQIKYTRQGTSHRL